MIKIKAVAFICIFFSFTRSFSQVKVDTIIVVNHADSVLRIKNLNPYFTLQVDSTLKYQYEINKEQEKYYWFLKNSPVGLKINKDNGTLTFKAEKSYFLSGRLKYDYEYKIATFYNHSEKLREHLATKYGHTHL